MNGLVVSRNLSLRDRAFELKTVASVILTLVVSSGLAGGLASVLIFQPIFPGAEILSFAFALLVGFFVGIAVLAAGYFAQHKQRARRKRVLDLQKRLSETECDDICSELHSLVQGCLDLKDFRSADHYSAMLLKQSSVTPDERLTKVTEFMTSMGAWVSTAEYHKSLTYKTIWIYQSWGELTLSPTHLNYVSKRIRFQVDLADIRSIEIMHHPRWLRPNPTAYLRLNFIANGQEQRIFVTPSYSETECITRVNECVEIWSQLIRSAVEKRVAVRAMDKMRAQIPGIETNNEQRVN